MQKPLRSKMKGARNPIILANEGIMPSTRELRDAIEKVTGVHYWIRQTPDSRDILLRYGNSMTAIGKDLSVQTPELINTLSHKLRFSRQLLGADIPTIEFNSVGASFQDLPYPIMIRSTLTSFGGRGITVVANPTEFSNVWRNGFYWTRFITFTTEYRAHVANGKVLRIFEKEREEGFPDSPFPIRNSDNGWHFSIRNRAKHRVTIESLVANLVTKLPMYAKGFFALDLGWEASTKTMYIIEGNSAPGLNENTALAYAEALFGKGNSTTEVQASPAVAEAVPQTVQEVTNEVVRPNSNAEGTGRVSPTNSVRTERKPAPVRSEWEW